MPFERRQAIDLDAHKRDPFAHHNSHFASSGGVGGVETVQVAVDRPDLLGTAEVRMIHAHADWAGNGLTVKTVKIDTGESSTYSVTFEVRTEPTDGSPITIATVATSTSTEAETDVLTNVVVNVGNYIYATLPATDVNNLGLEVNFTVN